MQGFNNQFNKNRPHQNKWQQGPVVEEKYTIKNPLKQEWFTDGADENLVSYAEKAGKEMADGKLTNSKIRSIFGEIKRIQMAGFNNEKPSFYLLRPKVAYAYGRDRDITGLKVFKDIFDDAYKYVKDEKSFLRFCDFMEAILAYHRANGGK